MPETPILSMWSYRGAALRDRMMVRLATYAGMEVGPTREDYMMAHEMMMLPDNFTDEQHDWLRRAMREAEHLGHVVLQWPIIELTAAGRQYAVSVMTPTERRQYDVACATGAAREANHARGVFVLDGPDA